MRGGNEMKATGYFTVHLPSFNLMHVHWVIDNAFWDKIIVDALLDSYGDPQLLIRVVALHGTEWIQDQQIDVFGRNNHWIVAVGNHLHGRTIKVILAIIMESNGDVIIFESSPIALPVSSLGGSDTIPIYTKEMYNVNNITPESDAKRISS